MTQQLTAIITGASSGIGKATAELFAQNGIKLVLCGRRIERLEKIQKQLASLVPVHVLYFDVREQKDVAEKLGNLPKEFSKVDILVNNAGNAHGLEPIDQGSIDDWDAMIDINVKGLLYVSKAIIPNMIAQKNGHIINIGSIAGKEVYINGNVYCASKHAVDAITQGMRLDLTKYGIKITGINPGLVETEFSLIRFKGDLERADKVYEGITPLHAKDVAETIYFAISRPKHVTVADITVLASAQASATEVYRSIH